jgi:thermitase
MRSTQRSFLIFVLASFALPAFAQPPASLPAYVADQVVVGFVPGTPRAAIADAHRQAGATAIRSIDQINAQVVRIASGNVTAAVAAYRNNPNVRYAEPNYLRPVVLPNEGTDPPPPTGLGIDYFDEQYGLNNTGQSFYYDEWTGQPGAISGVTDADIDAPEAWDLSTGSPAVTVAVLDTGVDCAHPDLVGKCVENVNLGPSSTLDDQIGHGTHVAGIAAATGNNGIGIAGVGWQTSIASIKVCYEYYDVLYGLIGLCDSAASAEGMIHAADQGYQVVNMSYAGPTGSQAEADAAAYAFSHGTVLVAAAANSYELTPMYPAAFSEVIGVAATDWFDNLAGFSNFGGWVSLAAPGYYIFSTLPNAACGLAAGDPEGCYGWLSGTSMASPMVAGAAAVVYSYQAGGATPVSVRAALENNADATGAMGQNMLAWTANGRLNLYNALLNGGGGAPPPSGDPGVHVGDLDGTATNQGSTWMASVTITVHDETESPVDGVTVQGNWSGGYIASGGCTTSAGQCMISTGGIPKRNSTVTFQVTTLGPNYLGGANHDPDGDSDGSSITIAK